MQLAIAIQQAELVARLNQELLQRAEIERSLSLQAQEQAWLIGELDKTTALLRDRNQELDSFVLLASHDLRAPLRSIAKWKFRSTQPMTAVDLMSPMMGQASIPDHIQIFSNCFAPIVISITSMGRELG